jgi:hypothetical protein
MGSARNFSCKGIGEVVQAIVLRHRHLGSCGNFVEELQELLLKPDWAAIRRPFVPMIRSVHASAPAISMDGEHIHAKAIRGKFVER